MNGNLFSGNYFDMNKDHLAGRLKPMRWTPGSLLGVKTTTLTLSPLARSRNGDIHNDEL